MTTIDADAILTEARKLLERPVLDADEVNGVIGDLLTLLDQGQREREGLEQRVRFYEQHTDKQANELVEAKRLNDFKDSLIWQSRESALYKDVVAAEKRWQKAEAELAASERSREALRVEVEKHKQGAADLFAL